MRNLMCIVFIIGGCCLGCDREDGTTTLKAHIMGMKVYITGDIPALVIVEYSGEVGGCDWYHDPELKWLGGNSFHIHALYESVPAGGDSCPDIIHAYDQQVILGRSYPGHYTVSINDDVAHFEIPPEPGSQTIEFF